MTSSHRPAASSVDSSEESAPALDLSFSKITIGALTAVSTAVVASFFGVTGTLTGAAFGSIASSVLAALYAASFHTARTRIRTTRTLVTRSSRRAAGRDPQDPAGLPPELTGRSTPLPGETAVLTTSEGSEDTDEVLPRRPRAADRARRGRRLGWKPIAVLSGIIFVVALGAISATELVLGHPISDSRDTGTSIGTAVRGSGGGLPAKEDDRSETESPTNSPSESGTESSDESVTKPGSDQTPSPGEGESVAPGEETSGPGQPEEGSSPTGDGGGDGPVDDGTDGGAVPTGSPLQGGQDVDGAVPAATSQA